MPPPIKKRFVNSLDNIDLRNYRDSVILHNATAPFARDLMKAKTEQQFRDVMVGFELSRQPGAYDALNRLKANVPGFKPKRVHREFPAGKNTAKMNKVTAEVFAAPQEQVSYKKPPASTAVVPVALAARAGTTPGAFNAPWVTNPAGTGQAGTTAPAPATTPAPQSGAGGGGGGKKKKTATTPAPEQVVSGRGRPVDVASYRRLGPEGPVRTDFNPTIAASVAWDRKINDLAKNARSAVTVKPPTAEEIARAKAGLRQAKRDRITDKVNQIGAKAQEIIPYASNLISAFRKLPRGEFAGNVPYIAAPKTRMDAARADVLSGLRAQMGVANRSLDENTAAAVNATNYAQSLQQMGRIGEAEAQQDTQRILGAGEANSRIGMYNNQAQQNFMDENVNRRIMEQNFRSANLANAADKYVTQQSQEADRQSMLDAVQMYNANDINGVKRRLALHAQQLGVGNPEDWQRVMTSMPAEPRNPLTYGQTQGTNPPTDIPYSQVQPSDYLSPYGQRSRRSSRKSSTTTGSFTKGGQLRGPRWRKTC